MNAGFANMPADPVWLEIIAIRKGELPNDGGEFRCDVPACECLFYTRLDLLLHRKRGQHGRMNYEETFRRVVGNYATRAARPKEAQYAQKRL